jgi:hypothetical protein
MVIKSQWMRWMGHAACIDIRKVLVGKHEGKKLLGRPKQRW